MSSLTTTTAASLKSSQLRAIYRMLAFNDENAITKDSDDDYQLPPAGSSHNQWKILIYDVACRSIISPLLNVSQLRRRGVTLHLLLHSDREYIPDVPAIYFVKPTKENLAKIAQDCSKQLYGRMHLNFVTKLDRTIMEEFAKLVVQTGSLSCIASVHDQYLDYVCLERHLFSLHKQNSYVLYHDPTTSEERMEAAMTEIAYGLFSVVATLGKIPIIRCEKAGAPEMVARKVNRMIAEHPTLLRQYKSGDRPLLVILDRNADLITPVQHTSTYQALLDDLLKHNANRVEFIVATTVKEKIKKEIKKFDLDPDTDPFYQNHKWEPFPEAIESNGAELEQVTAREREIRSKAGGASADQTSDLAMAVESLPALLDRKKQLEMHTSILQAVMKQVAARDVPQFFELASGLATGVYKNDPQKAKKDVLEMIQSKGNVTDKCRLIVLYCLTIPQADVDQATAVLEQVVTEQMSPTDEMPLKTMKEQLQGGLKAVNYIKQWRSMHNMMMVAWESQSEEPHNLSSRHPSSDLLSNFMAKATTQATGFLAKATDKVMTSMLGNIHKHYATRVVEHLCDMKPNTEDDEYLYLDPKVKGDVNVAKLRTMTRAPVKEVIAFMIGGGCYAEYQNLQMIANDRRTVTYGSTELVNPCQFLSQLGQLG